MAKWYDDWLTPQEKKSLQVGQKGIRARRRMKQDPENTRGYPKSGDQYQKEAANNAIQSRTATASRGYGRKKYLVALTDGTAERNKSAFKTNAKYVHSIAPSKTDRDTRNELVKAFKQAARKKGK